jgi:RNA polymerase sigma-70 factor (ECF subfamily)
MLDLSPIADDQLMRNVANGDATSLEVLYDRYVRQCFGLALRLLNNPQIAEEVVQEVFTKLWSRPDSYSATKGKFASWLLSLVHHRCIDELRRRSNNEARLEDPVTGSLLDTQLDPAPDPSDQVALMEQQVAVRQALQELVPNQREVLMLAYFGGLSQSQIASELKQPLGTVKTRVRMGLQKLKLLLDARGISVEEDG